MKSSNPLLFKAKQNSLPRNAFDLSHHSYFTSPAGLLLPAYVEDVNPGDFFKISVENFTRTQPCATAAFVRLKENVDFYFVPYRLIWRWFSEFYTSIQNTDSSYNPNGVTVPVAVPYIKGSQFYELLTKSPADMEDLVTTTAAAYKVYRLMDQLGYPVKETLADTQGLYAPTTGPLRDVHFNIFRIFAYMRLYHDFYRNTDFETNDPAMYNLDKYSSGGQIQTSDLVNAFKFCGYKNWAKDMFTSVKPSPLYSVFGGINNFVGQKPYLSSDDVGAIGDTTWGPDLSSTTVASLRNAFAVDKLARLSMLAPKTYADQLKAHFGVDPDNCDYCSCRYLGSFDSNIDIGEITATAAGTNSGTDYNDKSVLGQIAGKGIGSARMNRPIHQSFNEPGIILGMHYVVPMAEYDSNRVSQFNRKFIREDYFVPEYDSLGMQPLLQGDVNQTSTSNPNTVLGYQARYLEYKSRVDEVHGQFQSGGALSMWAAPRQATMVPNVAIQWQDFKVNPVVLDPIFMVSFDGSPLSDPFLCHFRFDVQRVANMSVMGLPSL